MLNEWVFDARLMEQEVTRFFILLHTDTTLIDWSCSFAGRDSSASALSLALYILKIAASYFRIIGQSSYMIIRSGWITSTRVSTVSFAVVLCSHPNTRACRLLRLQKLLIYAAIDNLFLSVYTTLGHPALISALGYLSAISILQLYYITIIIIINIITHFAHFSHNFPVP